MLHEVVRAMLVLWKGMKMIKIISFIHMCTSVHGLFEASDVVMQEISDS